MLPGLMSSSSKNTVAAFLFGSGFCALIYQTVWLREFRLIFGASTAASAAVLGIFMGGLGLGSALLGGRSEKAKRPLQLYGNLELWIAVFTALTPALFWLVRKAYEASGGSMVLGPILTTPIRLLLSTLVLIIPTFLMGGTLPAAARSVSGEADTRRRSLALLYGCNTLGAVAGAAVSTFVLIETFGNQTTLWLACVVNLAIALLAKKRGSSGEEMSTDPAVDTPQDHAEDSASPRFVILAAASVGFAFMLMELVWYRMLSPLLGGSTFTFGLILVIALLGVGLGGALYALNADHRRPTAQGFAFTCALEALLIAIPYAMGDGIAELALMARSLGAMGFGGSILVWSLITGLVVLPAALVAGYQFPMLIALLGCGRDGVGRQTGLAYAANTGGAIVGSLAGGFGLLPLLTSPGVWKSVVLTLAGLALVASILAWRRGQRSILVGALTAFVAIGLLAFPGPTAVWRHSGIGAGRATLRGNTINAIERWSREQQRAIIWEAEGVESSVAINGAFAYSFVINGKSDGSVLGDAGTQVMGGLVGALLHPDPKRSMVIGLGTGSTAGWLGAIPGMERVDVIELEPSIFDVARMCAPVNRDVMNNPKVKMHLGDAREALLTTRDTYDIIFSEPSNPYRAGIASLFTREFYEAARGRLNPGGLFMQWVQAYEVDGEAIQTVYATLSAVFSHVQTWQTQEGDMLLIATVDPLTVDLPRLESRVTQEPYRSALACAWGVFDAPGVLAHFLANDQMARAVVESNATVATDDRNALEFGVARGVGRAEGAAMIGQLKTYATANGWNRPDIVGGSVNWDQVEIVRFGGWQLKEMALPPAEGESPPMSTRRAFAEHNLHGDYALGAELWQKAPFEPAHLDELEFLTMALLSVRDPRSQGYLDRLRTFQPAAADVVQAHEYVAKQQWNEALDLFIQVFKTWETSPWASHRLEESTMRLAADAAQHCKDPIRVKQLIDQLFKPFATGYLCDLRLKASLAVAQSAAEPAQAIRAALDAYGAHFPWEPAMLKLRVQIYRQLHDPRLDLAVADLAHFQSNEPIPFSRDLPDAKNRR